MTALINIALSLAPVVVFLAGLIALDSYKLITLRSVVTSIIAGAIAAFLSMFANDWILTVGDISVESLKRYIAPVVEEFTKALWLIFLIRSRQVGFMVDAAIFGFAIGTGFAIVENVYYLNALPEGSVALWIVRGFGTAIMHGGVTAIFGVISQELTYSKGSTSLHLFVPGLLVAAAIHMAYNHFILPPMLSTLALLIIQPALLYLVFLYSEKALQKWLGQGMDAELELYEIITRGGIANSHIGNYLETLKERFSGPVVADMLCYLRIHLELALAAKGFLLMRQSGHKTEVDPQIRAQFDELKFLENSLGHTGKLAIAPIIHTSDRDLWQMYMIRE